MTGARHPLHRRGQETLQRLCKRRKPLQMNTIIISLGEETGKPCLRKCLQWMLSLGKEKTLPHPSFLALLWIVLGSFLPAPPSAPPTPTFAKFVSWRSPHSTHKKSTFLRCLSSSLMAGETQVQRGSCIFYEFHITELSDQWSGLGSWKIGLISVALLIHYVIKGDLVPWALSSFHYKNGANIDHTKTPRKKGKSMLKWLGSFRVKELFIPQ